MAGSSSWTNRNSGSTCMIRRLVLGMGTQAMQQLAGINVISYYLPVVFIRSVGLSNEMTHLLTACNSVSYLLFSLIGIPSVERWAQGKMVMYAAAGQCFCDLIITTMIRHNEDPALSDTTRVSYAKVSIAFFFLRYVLFRHRLARCPMRLIHSACGRKALRWAPLRTGSSTSWSSKSPLQAFNLCDGNSRSPGPPSTSLLCPSFISSVPRLPGVRLKTLTVSLLAAHQCL